MTGGATRRPGLLEWAVLLLLCLCAVLSGTLELMLVPLYIGSVVVPVAVVGGVVGNVVLPVWGYRAVRSGIGAVAPVACWLATVLALAMVSRPEGDLFVLGAYGEQWNFYALLFIGAIAGFGAVVRVTGPRLGAPR